MNAVTDFDISKVLNTLNRQKGLIVSVFVVVASLAVYLATVLPNVYQSNALILVTPQRVPTSFVASTVTIDLSERMRSITQEIMSRTQLEKIVQEFNLYIDSKKVVALEDRVNFLRKSIKIESHRNNVFQLSFESEDPENAKQVTSRLGSLFIEQNLNAREQQAQGTKSFINAETQRLRKELEEQETVVTKYKAAHAYELPDQLDTNLRSLEQLRRALQGNNERLSVLQDRKGVLQKQNVEADIPKVDPLAGPVPMPGIGITQDVQIEMKKKELDSLLQRYSNKHPDVIRAKKEIQALENNSSESIPSQPNSPKSSSISPVKRVLLTQITDIDSEIKALNMQSEGIRSQISVLQARVDSTPVRALELAKISRGYDITLKKYQDLLAKSLESELAENMEKKQKGEQFQILDPANFPVKPARPNRLMIILMGLGAGLAGGIGLAIFWDNLDSSFRRAEEISAYVNVPLLATLPALVTRGSVLEQRRAQGLLVLASIGTLAVGLACVRILGPMYF
jgi:polysaccharide chain length determinant protein (PEP-CTERM system associated)